LTAAAILLAGVGALAAFAGWVLPRPILPAAAAAATLAGATLFAVLETEPVDDAARAVMLVVAGLLAVLGGGPAATAVFNLADREQAGANKANGSRPRGNEIEKEHPTLENAGEVLRGGAWIGALERAAIYVTVVAGWPAGLAVVLALKGLGRYPELRVREDSGAAERFIIGTLASALWAIACAGLALVV
jgi:hypothetical protein